VVVVWLTGSCDSKVDGKAFSTAEKEHLDEGNWLTTRVIQSGEEMTAIPFLFFTRTVCLKHSSEAKKYRIKNKVSRIRAWIIRTFDPGGALSNGL
jgi:hypothetical protein